MSHFLTNQMAQIYQQKKKKFIAIWWPARAFASNKLCQHTHSYALNAIPSNTKFSWFITTNTHPQIQNYISWFITTGRPSLASLISLPFRPSPTQREKTQKSQQNTHTHTHTHTHKTQKNSKKYKNSVIREDSTKNFKSFFYPYLILFPPLSFLFRLQFSLHFLCSQTSTGAITKG